jgi:hypothetical protein
MLDVKGDGHMKALEVFVNGLRVSLAGVGDDGVLNAIVSWVGHSGRDDDLFLQIGGLDSQTNEHLHWKAPSIGVGAEVLVRVIEAVTVDPPSERIRYEKQTCVDEYRQQLQECSGWLTPAEGRQLLQELIAELQALDAKPDAGIM